MLGSMDVGERIFRQVPDVNHYRCDMSLVALWDEQTTDPGINALIGRVYGNQSRQMAHRYYVPGEHCRCRAVRLFLGDSEQTTEREFFMAELWFKKSAEIYRRYPASEKLADTMSNVAYSLVKQGKFRESRASLAETQSVIATYGDQGTTVGTHQRISLVEHYLEESREGSSLE
jgi:hypothetical protein